MNAGTCSARLTPFREASEYDVFGMRRPSWDELQTITLQQECRKFSLEELRVFDNNQGTNMKTASDSSAPVM